VQCSVRFWWHISALINIKTKITVYCHLSLYSLFITIGNVFVENPSQTNSLGKTVRFDINFCLSQTLIRELNHCLPFMRESTWQYISHQTKWVNECFFRRFVCHLSLTLWFSLPSIIRKWHHNWRRNIL